ncbi:MAG TPA: phosphoribosylformylglycinamidine cyclo-ligase [Thermodesulfobacteriota bacterium]|nr:phosphoribosylformylglycinamidine cyclo-ligase [Thermodesulfobacteriota bacterium]
MADPLTYRDAGVDIEAGHEVVARIRGAVRSTYRPEVLGDLGGFGALFRFDAGRYHDPVLVSSTDGVGTKLKIAFLLDKHDTVGIDLVAMCVNDVVVQGAEPLFLLDYFACGRLDPARAAEVIGGIAAGCREAGCALVGGETAEMPGVYAEGEYDLAGFAVGVVERERLLPAAGVGPGDRLVALPSSGLHANGFSLVRRIVFDRLGLKVTDRVEALGRQVTLGEALLTPTRIYVRPLLAALAAGLPVLAAAHITGGGLLDNLPRVLPRGVRAVLDRRAWEWPAIFRFLQEAGGVPEAEMLRTFNCGLGLVLVVRADGVEAVCRALAAAGERPLVVGQLEAAPPAAGGPAAAPTVVVA